jgi:PKD repeat protein
VVTAPDTVLSGASGYAASTSQVPGAAYAWSITNGTITSGAGNPSITFSSQAAGPLQLGVTVTSGAGCVSAQGTKTVTVLPVGFFALTPCRLFDTRIASGPAAAAPPLQPIATRIFAPTGNCSVPPTAKALSLNVTVTNVAASGYVLLYPSDVAAPTASTISFRQGLTRANNTIVKISSDGSSTFAALNGSPGTVDIIFDVNGYFQ